MQKDYLLQCHQDTGSLGQHQHYSPYIIQPRNQTEMFWLHHTTKTSLKPSVVRPETMRERRLLSNPSLTFDCLTSLGLLTIGVQLKAALTMLRVSVALLRVGRQLYYWLTTLLRQEKKPTVPHSETRLGHITSVLSQLESNLNQMGLRRQRL